MAIPGVVGTAIGQDKGKPCILVLTASNTEQIRKKIPATVDGYPVIVQYTGEIRAWMNDRKARQPCPGGVAAHARLILAGGWQP